MKHLFWNFNAFIKHLLPLKGIWQYFVDIVHSINLTTVCIFVSETLRQNQYLFTELRYIWSIMYTQPQNTVL